MDNQIDPFGCGYQSRKSGAWNLYLSEQNINTSVTPVINVVGTNGKSTTSFLLAYALQNHYSRVGVFLSPTMYTHNERIQINQKCISDKDLLVLIKKHNPIWNHYQLNFFERWTALALIFFKQNSVDIAVIEAGIGGKYDATKAWTQQKIVVLTQMGLDHQKLLGFNLTAVTSNQIGVIHNFNVTSVVTAENNLAYKSLLKKLIKSLFWAPLLPYPKFNVPPHIVIAWSLILKTMQLLGFQFVKPNWKITYWGRYHKINGWPHLIIDGAHNVAGVSWLVKNIKLNQPDTLFLFGCYQGKNGSQIYKWLIKNQINFRFCLWDQKKAWVPKDNHDQAQQNINNWKEFLINNRTKHIVVCGSLYFIPEVIAWVTNYVKNNQSVKITNSK